MACMTIQLHRQTGKEANMIGLSDQSARRPTRAEESAVLKSIQAQGALSDQQAGILHRRLRREYRRLQALACSAPWLEDCWTLGVDYAPDAPCHCPRCQGKRKFPAAYVNGSISFECQLESR